MNKMVGGKEALEGLAAAEAAKTVKNTAKQKSEQYAEKKMAKNAFQSVENFAEGQLKGGSEGEQPLK
ncbi:MAG: hypothetical protein QM632_06180 [Micrococcaceae bacterium]